jgi:hypothetical protein
LIDFGRNRILALVGGVVVASAAAWFGWQYFEDTGPPPAALSKPQALTAAKAPVAARAAAPADTGAARDKLIVDALIASGMKHQLDQLPQQITAGVRQSGAQQSKTPPAVLKAIEDAVAGSFTAQGFQNRVSADLKKNFDQKRLQALLKDFSTPAAKRMIEMGQAAPSPEELARFARSAAAAPPSSLRASLIKRIDAAIRAGDLAVDAALSSMRAVALGLAGDGVGKTAAVMICAEKYR